MNVAHGQSDDYRDRSHARAPRFSICSLLTSHKTTFYPFSLPPFFFFNDTATTEIYTLSLHDALPIWLSSTSSTRAPATPAGGGGTGAEDCGSAAAAVLG